MNKKYFIFDFDSTFVKVESLDSLAELSLTDLDKKEGVLKEIAEITDLAMEGKMEYFSAIKKRLSCLHITKHHVDLTAQYLKNQVSDSIKSFKSFFQQYKDNIYVISGGFKELIVPVVADYGISANHVYANTFLYDYAGRIIGFDENNPLAKDDGKAALVKSLNLQSKKIVVGDGYNDYCMKKAGVVDKFYAFSENIRREPVVAVADQEIKSLHDFIKLESLESEIKEKNKIKVLLLENINDVAKATFEQNNFEVESLKNSLDETELLERIKDVNILGIRSKTNISKNLINKAENLYAIGAFCIGTNQIDLDACAKKGISVFNAPYSNTRSVVELAIGEIILLVRRVFEKSTALHQGKWQKSSDNSNEVRGKRLGIIGYGNIGAQLSVVAESLGMDVYYYDSQAKLPLGMATQCASIDELLSLSDVVTIHVDGSKDNNNLIGEREIDLMKNGAVLLNLSRGKVVDLQALEKALRSGKLKGAGIDVYPTEPKTSNSEFETSLQNIPNVILTPHIGGSTEEAQNNIGEFVSTHLTKYVNHGNTITSVNFPNIKLPEISLEHHRIIHIHNNVPGRLAEINKVFADNNINVEAQYLKTAGDLGYVITDIGNNTNIEFVKKLEQIENTIKVRVLY